MTPASNRRLALSSLGCRVNFDDGDQLAHRAAAAGFRLVPFTEVADVYVVNSCTVTRAADSQTRKLARAARRRNPEARVVVTGCSAEVGPEPLQAMTEVDLVLGNLDKPALLELLAAYERGELDGSTRSESVRRARSLTTPLVPASRLRQRPVLKVQDGCNHRCSFCVIPRARGHSRSLPVAAVAAQLRAYADAGVAEVVLSGVHLASYGRDLDETIGLEELLAQVASIPGIPRLRLSSIEPVDMTPGVIDLLADRPEVFCRFLHMAVQSGSTRVLAAMKRRYSRESFLERTGYLFERLPGLGLGLDLLVGFPGETDEDFEQTVSLVEGLPVLHAHIFPYSERPETGALGLPGSIPVKDRRAHAQRLREVAAGVQARVLAQIVGERFTGIAVRRLVKAGGTQWLRLVTETGVDVDVPDEEQLELGLPMAVEIVGVQDGVLGRLLAGADEARIAV